MMAITLRKANARNNNNNDHNKRKQQQQQPQEPRGWLLVFHPRHNATPSEAAAPVFKYLYLDNVYVEL